MLAPLNRLHSLPNRIVFQLIKLHFTPLLLLLTELYRRKKQLPAKIQLIHPMKHEIVSHPDPGHAASLEITTDKTKPQRTA